MSGQKPVIHAPADLELLLTGPDFGQLAQVLASYIRARRWFRSKARRIREVGLHDLVPVPFECDDECQTGLAIFDVKYTAGHAETYVLPLALARGDAAERIVAHRPKAHVADVAPEGCPGSRWLLYDAMYQPTFSTALLDAIGGRRRFRGRSGGRGIRGAVTATPTRAHRRLRGPRGTRLEPRVSSVEQSNTSVVFGERLILKLFRRLEPGINPDLELGMELTERGFANAPAVGGWLAYHGRDGEPAVLGILQAFVPNRGDVWEHTLASVGSFFERVSTHAQRPPTEPSPSIAAVVAAGAGATPPLARETIGDYLDVCALLGQRTAQLHAALAAAGDDPAFAPEPSSAAYRRAVLQAMRAQAAASLGLLRDRIDGLAPDSRAQAEHALGLADDIEARLGEVTRTRATAALIRTHGDLHCGQVLWTGGDVVFIDFEGEPGLPLAERRHRRSAMTDVAGMLRSFHYAAFGTLHSPRVGSTVRPEDVTRLEEWADFWYLWVAATFVRAYRAQAAGQPFMPAGRAELVALLDISALHKVLYELSYELNNRPDWVSIPLRGLLELLGASTVSQIPEIQA